MKACVISLGSISSKWVVESLKKYFEVVDDIDLQKIEVSITDKGWNLLYHGKKMESYDCVYLKGSFRYSNLLRTIATALEGKSYTPICAEAFTVGHDKIINHIAFQKQNIPTPKTYLFPSLSSAKKFLKEGATYPLIIKIPNGTQGKGVLFVDSYASASSILDTLSALRQAFLVQEYVETGGSDIRAIVVGNKLCAAMVRKAQVGEKRANIHAGGEGVPFVADEKTKKIAIAAAKATGAEICAIDILLSSKGPVVIEANLSPGLQGITRATKIDVAGEIAKFLFEQTKKFKMKKNGKEQEKIFQDLGIACSAQEGDKPSLITNLEIKNGKLIIPKEIYSKCDFADFEEYYVECERGKLTIKKMLD
ncbi:MAG TPA: RimK family alpha-L-glutamate ligase [Candidatus Woesearchaeota archaeon]|nr:RimK family alpha-L-glutamate ligase [Candidatus Woesearchaeota archaeon]